MLLLRTGRIALSYYYDTSSVVDSGSERQADISKPGQRNHKRSSRCAFFRGPSPRGRGNVRDVGFPKTSGARKPIVIVRICDFIFSLARSGAAG